MRELWLLEVLAENELLLLPVTVATTGPYRYYRSDTIATTDPDRYYRSETGTIRHAERSGHCSYYRSL
jgi:hypothetical protein